ncbi:MAG: prepilin-type N-terminal cleavage/methylation domain-containing protein [Gammaproteobacteria bacterium]|nr:prepilin-type N-terminal cleavage/methylation domain-containing protein [Gammaproteobacteria bacterium]MBU2056836.1 prepilin-type N-terminal cleavage/methylation domain-containing protein [Gammaproteobacteria bacterium]MBU2174632.1 prepilin-type N-terminal cleavage/methylation domain-containing protein [Gammaproteobacteria bacterium]MBU2248325.1 prepilin-type N-terminal cleavage/methylation domain-containing protein [Gammaproteobacteria bacterium]MBU2346194.1 prepilin-type N-terminal cleavag
MKTLNKQQGFTLVELIIVIVILGILAVTAAPRFLNFQGDAKASVLAGVEGSLRAAISLVNGKALIAGQNTAALACFEANNVRAALQTEIDATPAAPANTNCASGVDVAFGAPDSDVTSLQAVADFPNNFVLHDTESATALNLTPALVVAAGNVDMAANLADLTAGNCIVRYTAATATTAATVELVNEDECE